MTDDCLFCKIVDKKQAADIVFENEQLIVFKDIFPKSPVHLLVVPKKHMDSLNELSEEDSELISHLMLQLPRIAKDNGIGDGYRTIANTGSKAGQVIFHLHFHLMGGGEGKLPGF